MEKGDSIPFPPQPAKPQFKMITQTHADPRQTAIWKSMSLSEKYELLAATIRQSRNLKRIGLRMKFPDDTAAETETKLARIWLHARS